jgi:hypothetical protein
LATSGPFALIAGLAIGVYSTSQTVSKDLQEALQAVEAARMSDYIELRVSEMGRQSRGYALTSEFQRWYPPRDLSVESIQNRKSKILKPPHLSVGSI